MSLMRVPFVDLKGQYQRIEREVLEAIQEVLKEQTFILGPQVTAFEEKIARYLEVPYAVGVGSGSDALLLSLMALGVEPGDEVMTTPYTFFATSGAISRLGATPVFVDIDPCTFNINPRLVESKMTRKTKGILPVHLFGQSAEMDLLMEIARRHELWIIEDAAQAIGATYRGKRVGGFGQCGCFSFFPTKNLGGYGDGGLVVTADRGLAERLRILRVHGSRERYLHEVVGINSRLDSLQAAVLSVKLTHLNGWIEERQKRAERYAQMFRELHLHEHISPPTLSPGNTHVFHQYVVRARQRDALRSFLQERGIGTEIYYSLPLHCQRCYTHLGYKKGDFPESERAAAESLALPISPELTNDQQEYTVETIDSFYFSS